MVIAKCHLCTQDDSWHRFSVALFCVRVTQTSNELENIAHPLLTVFFKPCFEAYWYEPVGSLENLCPSLEFN